MSCDISLILNCVVGAVCISYMGCKKEYYLNVCVVIGIGFLYVLFVDGEFHLSILCILSRVSCVV